ncbi:MAG: carboxypeptidase regulatory-like domain-containing protein, partial [Planctomycetes bacterium]|nr:carboxypeptidase regulatory-like domain-containing protein [Planctomycetota bacterium]
LRRAGAPETLQPETSRALATGADGTFELAGALAGGEWHAFVHGFETAESGRGRATFRVEAGAVTTGVELVTTALLARLRGIVVDARGAPIAGASVQHADAAFGTVATCGDDGAFALARFAPDAHESVTLRASAPGFEPRRVGPVAWGGDALRIELAPNAATWLEVVRDDDGSPVERYALHVTQAPGSSDGMVAQIASPTLPRAAGRAALAGLPRGPYLAWIEPEIAADVDPERAPLAAFLAEFAVDGDPTHAVLRAPAAGTRRVRVVDAAAAPVAGTRLELVLPVGEDAVTVRTRTELPLALAGAGALRVAEVTSDAAGEAELAGATGAVYALRVLGPGHRPVVVPAVTLGDELEPLIVQVAAGAAVVGNVTPVAALDELGPSASDRQMAAQLGARGESILADSRPQIVLRPLGGGALLPERASDGAVAVDGSYRIDGVPPGTWQVCLGTRIRGPGGASMSRLIVPLATVRDLGPGEERRADLDASKLRPGELRALVLVDGEPLRSGAVALLYRREGQHFGSQPIGETALPLRTDGDGHLVASLPPGDWAIEATVPGRNGGTAKLRNEQVAAVAPAATTECTFVLQRRTLQVRILCADGSPAKERRFSIMQEHYWAAAGTTDADGRLALESPPTGAFELVTWPPELAEQSAQTAYIKQHPYPQWLDVLVRIGPVQIPSGHSEATVELRLPH